jgi:hypothetical protein
MSDADLSLLQKFEALPAARAKTQLLAFVRTLIGDLRQAENRTTQVRSQLAPKAQKFDTVRDLVEEQGELLAHSSARNDQIEEELLAVLGLGDAKFSQAKKKK